MVDWYRHDIPAWMDGTQGLSGRAYRAYHVILQLIYIHEGPITLNERGLASACRQHVNSFRAALGELLKAGKLIVNDDGKLSNLRAETELNLIRTRRVMAGLRRGSVKDTRNNLLKFKPPE